MWEEKIEELYKSWTDDNELFGTHGNFKFIKFACACIQDEDNAPNMEELKSRIKRDLSEKYPGYNEDQKSKKVSEAESLYLALKYYEEIRKEN